MFHPSTIQLLRFPFSFFLLPVFLFALAWLPRVDWEACLLAFGILHLLVYPSSNGYNSYMDRDQSPIGGVKAPMQPTRQLFYTSLILDAAALGLSLFISPLFFLGILSYILASRAYSYRGIRLKRYPVLGFLTVFLAQGGLIFFITYHGCHPDQPLQVPLTPLVISSFLIGALYPLTQIYQHEADRRDGVETISYRLGKRGTFLFSALQFSAATGLFFWLFRETGQLNLWPLWIVYMLPVVLFFLYWMFRVWKDEEAANFANSMRMNLISTFCTTAFFITLNLMNH